MIQSQQQEELINLCQQPQYSNTGERDNEYSGCTFANATLFATPPASATLPKPPLKGILKNPSSSSVCNVQNQSAFSFSASELDVAPFDTVPPCDDCMDRARLEGTYSGQCMKPDCALGALNCRTAAATATMPRMHQPLQKKPSMSMSMNMTTTTSFRGSQESLLSNIGDKEVLENVESSV